MSLHTISPAAAEAAAREFVDIATDDSDWRDAYYHPDAIAADAVPPCSPTDYCGRCGPCHVLAFLTKAWQRPGQELPHAQTIDIAA